MSTLIIIYKCFPVVIIELSTAPQWIKFNYDQIGYYRVNYPEDLWQNLANQLLADPTVSDLFCKSIYIYVHSI